MLRRLLTTSIFLFIFASPLSAYAIENLNQILQAPYYGAVMGDGVGSHKATASTSPTLAGVNATSSTRASNFNLASTTNLTATKFWNSGITSALGLFDSNHLEGAYGGSSGVCTNQFPTSISAVGALGNCASVTDSFFSGVLGVTHGGTGLATLTGGGLMYGNGTGLPGFVSTTTVTAGTGMSFTTFVAFGPSPITINSTAVLTVTGAGGTVCTGTTAITCTSFSYPWLNTTYGSALAGATTTLQMITSLVTSTTTAGVINVGTLTASSSVAVPYSGILKGNGSASQITVAANGTDFTLTTAASCSAGAHISALTASGGSTCSADTGPFSYPFPNNAPSTMLTFGGGLMTGTSTIGNLTATSSVKLPLTGVLQGNGVGSNVTAITDSSTVGQVLRVTGASSYAWGALSLSTSAAITGTLPVANGGTGAASLSQSTLLASDASGNAIGTSTIAFQSFYGTSTATSTLAGGLNVAAINETGSASSTFVNGIDIAGGCFAISHVCLSTGGSGTPGGSGTNIQYRNGSSFGGVSLSAFDGTHLMFGTTTSTFASFNVGSSSQAQILLSDNSGTAANSWAMRAAGGFLYFSPMTSPTATSTSIVAYFDQVQSALYTTGGLLHAGETNPTGISFSTQTADFYANGTFKLRLQSSFNTFHGNTGTSGSLPLYVRDDGASRDLYAIDSNGQQHVGGKTALASGDISSCGTSPVMRTTPPSTDNQGELRIGTGNTTACTLTFKADWSSDGGNLGAVTAPYWPDCSVGLITTAATATVLTSSTTATTLIFRSSASMGGARVRWSCFGAI